MKKTFVICDIAIDLSKTEKMLESFCRKANWPPEELVELPAHGEGGLIWLFNIHGWALACKVNGRRDRAVEAYVNRWLEGA